MGEMNQPPARILLVQRGCGRPTLRGTPATKRRAEASVGGGRGSFRLHQASKYPERCSLFGA